MLSLPLGATLGACGFPVQAAAGQLVHLSLVERAGGDVLPEYRHRGTSYVAGRPGDRYAVRMSNRSNGRVLIVLSVDGINAVSGETAATGQTGYVLSPWQTADIVGWRKTDAEAAAFYFTALPDSYAARTDRPQNVGVIGLAVYRERVRPVPFEPVPYSGARPSTSGAERRAQAGADRDGAPASPPAPAPATAAAGSAGAGAAAEGEASDARGAQRADRMERPRLGTGHGEREYSPISRTSFERASTQPAEIVQVRYDSRANLVAAGVIGEPPPRRWTSPEPFPGYVPDPR
jgi:hypothetical protein